MATLTMLDFGDDATFRSILSKASKNGYRLAPEVYHRWVSGILLHPNDDNAMDALREWWMRAPLKDVLDVRRVIICYFHPTTKLASALASRVMTDVIYEPLSNDLAGKVVHRIDPTVQDFPPMDNPDVLWTDLALWAMASVINRKQILIEHEKAYALAEAERIDEQQITDPIEKLRILNLAKNASKKNIPSWLLHHTEKLGIHLSKLIAHVWESWSNPNILGKVPMDLFTTVLDLTAAVLPIASNPSFCDRFPIPFWLRILAGDTPLKSVPRRVNCLTAFARWKLQQADFDMLSSHPSTLQLASRALLDLGAESEPGQFWLLSIFDCISTMLRIDLTMDRPFLYEMTILRILSVGVPENMSSDKKVQSVMCEARTSYAIRILERLSVEYPERNVIQCIFWTLTEQFAQLSTQYLLQLQTRLSLALNSRGNREAIQELWSICSEDHLETWRKPFRGEPSSVMASKQTGIDAISNEPYLVPVRFAKEDTVCVGIETMLRQFATRGMINPFTNAPVTWETVAEANPDIKF